MDDYSDHSKRKGSRRANRARTVPVLDTSPAPSLFDQPAPVAPRCTIFPSDATEDLYPTPPTAAVAAGMEALERTAASHRDDIARIVPLAQRLALAAGARGIIMADVRLRGVQEGLLPADATGRALSWLGAVMTAAGLRSTALFRRSHIVRSHGIPQRVWVHETHYTDALHGGAS